MLTQGDGPRANILADIVISGLPSAFAWARGLLLGIDLAFGGESLISLALAARQ